MAANDTARRQRQICVTLGRWKLQGQYHREVLLTSTIHVGVPLPLVGSRSGPSVRRQRVLCVWQARSQAAGLPSTPAGEGGERRPWTEIYPDPHAAAAVHRLSCSAYPEQDDRDGLCVCHHSSLWVQDASKAVVAATEPAAPEASTQNDDDHVYICGPPETMAPVDNGLIETVQHQVS